MLGMIASSREVCACRAGDALGGLERLSGGVPPDARDAKAVREAAESALHALKSGKTIIRIDNDGTSGRLCPMSAQPWSQH